MYMKENNISRVQTVSQKVARREMFLFGGLDSYFFGSTRQSFS